MSRRLIQLGFIGWFCTLGALTSCGGDDDDGGGASGGSSSSGGSSGTGGLPTTGCVNIAGTWTVSKHCVPAAVNQQVQVTQTGCMFQVAALGLSGTIDAGTFTASGMVPGLGSATCTGTATATTITQDCMISGTPCAMTLVR